MKKLSMKTLMVGLALALSGCAVVPNGSKWIPKPVWYWSADAKEQRAERKAASDQPSKDWQGDLQKAIDIHRGPDGAN